jgi:hypothetical protein
VRLPPQAYPTNVSAPRVGDSRWGTNWYRLTVADAWSRKVLLSLVRRYDLKPYRFRNQRRTTVMVKVPESFLNETLWPEFQQIGAALRTYVDQITDRILADVFQGDSSEATEVAAPRQLLPAAARDRED